MKKIIKIFRQGRKIRMIAVLAIVAIATPLVANTILQRQKEAKADSFFKFDEGYGTISAY